MNLHSTHETQQIIALAIDVFSTRMLTFTALLMTAGFAAWAMWNPSWERLATLCAFMIFVFLPLLRIEVRQISGDKQ